MKLNFQILTTAKRQKIVDDADKKQDDKEFLFHIEGTTIIGEKLANDQKPLVIPLLKSVNHESQGLDDIAARELISELSSNDQLSGSNLIILSNATNSILSKKAPLLLANIPEEIRAITDDGERFKADIMLRPENIDVKSESYKSVPIEEFGAAMLRGMGWSGKQNDESKTLSSFDVLPRENRLGLGAAPKPPEEKGKGHRQHHHNHRDKDSKKEKERQRVKEKWDKGVEDRLDKQDIQIGDIVWLRDVNLFEGRRAVVVETRGVPGLNKVRVAVEREGLLLEVSKSNCILLSELEVAHAPFDHARPTTESIKAVGNSRQGVSSASFVDMGEGGGNTKKRGGDRDREERVERGGRPEKSSRAVATDVPSEWVRAGVLVKVVSKKVLNHSSLKSTAKCTGSDFYLRKGAVVDIARDEGGARLATIRFDVGNTVYVVDNVKEKYLETVLPSAGETAKAPVMVLKGPHAGRCGLVLDKNHDRETVTVQLADDITELLQLSMNDVSCVSTSSVTY